MSRRPTSPGSLSRRRLGQLVGGGALAATLPSRTALATDAASRRFIFLFARGGWDPLHAFAPLFDSEHVDIPEEAELAEQGGRSWVSHPEQDAVDGFFTHYGDRVCLLNGVEIPSVAHDRCRKLVMCGGSDVEIDDMGVILGAHAQGSPALPHMVLSGPIYAGKHAGAVARVGEEGQFQELLDGSALLRSDVDLALLDSDVEAAVDALVRERSAMVADGGWSSGQAARFYEGRLSALERLVQLRADLGDIDLGDTTEGGKVKVATDLLAAGLSRSVMVELLGAEGTNWDTHVTNAKQSSLYQGSFAILLQLLNNLDVTPGLAGGSLADETTVVFVSEMGRFPQLNASGGKDHWTFTSTLLIGAGVRGGSTVGAFDEYLVGQPLDFETGELTESGDLMSADDLVATVLALGDVDPGDYVPHAKVISAALE